MCRIYVVKKSTGAIWSSSNPHLGVWRKESMGIKFNNTKPYGYVSMNFFPFSKRWQRKSSGFAQCDASGCILT